MGDIEIQPLYFYHWMHLLAVAAISVLLLISATHGIPPVLSSTPSVIPLSGWEIRGLRSRDWEKQMEMELFGISPSADSRAVVLETDPFDLYPRAPVYVCVC